MPGHPIQVVLKLETPSSALTRPPALISRFHCPLGSFSAVTGSRLAIRIRRCFSTPFMCAMEGSTLASASASPSQYRALLLDVLRMRARSMRSTREEDGVESIGGVAAAPGHAAPGCISVALAVLRSGSTASRGSKGMEGLSGGSGMGTRVDWYCSDMLARKRRTWQHTRHCARPACCAPRHSAGRSPSGYETRCRFLTD
mmetsp:Transcript_41773/g.106922  ORF Transcript_41773/g.106922 Transcript_41773/m.106922 type:complete len:200 (+) Transcript_41773:1252-1851(+)